MSPTGLLGVSPTGLLGVSPTFVNVVEDHGFIRLDVRPHNGFRGNYLSLFHEKTLEKLLVSVYLTMALEALQPM